MQFPYAVLKSSAATINSIIILLCFNLGSSTHYQMITTLMVVIDTAVVEDKEKEY